MGHCPLHVGEQLHQKNPRPVCSSPVSSEISSNSLSLLFSSGSSVLQSLLVSLIPNIPTRQVAILHDAMILVATTNAVPMRHEFAKILLVLVAN